MMNGVYAPQAWADEHMQGTEDDADGIKDGVYWAQDFGAAVRFWSFVLVGVTAATVAGLYWGERNTLAGGSGEEELGAEDHYNLLG